MRTNELLQAILDALTGGAAVPTQYLTLAHWAGPYPINDVAELRIVMPVAAHIANIHYVYNLPSASPTASWSLDFLASGTPMADAVLLDAPASDEVSIVAIGADVGAGGYISIGIGFGAEGSPGDLRIAAVVEFVPTA